MKKIKTILAFALALSMCVSTAACGKSDGGEKDDTEEKVTTTAAAESVSEETESKAEAETEATTTAENADESSAGEAAETSEADTVESAEGISFTELEAIIPNIVGKDIDTAEKTIIGLLGLTSTREDFGPFGDENDMMSYTWEITNNLIINGIDFDDVAITTKNNATIDIILHKTYENSETEFEGIKKMKNILTDAGYSEASDNNRKYYETNYGRVYIESLTTHHTVTFMITELH